MNIFGKHFELINKLTMHKKMRLEKNKMFITNSRKREQNSEVYDNHNEWLYNIN